MQETEVRDLLQAYTADAEPPMRLSSEAVVAAGRRSRRVRRMAAVTGAGLTAVLVAAGVMVAPQMTGPSTTTAAAPECPSPPGPRPPGVIAPDQPLSDELVDWAAASLTCYLSYAMPRMLPDAEFLAAPGALAGPLVGFSLPERTSIRPPSADQPRDGDWVDAQAVIQDPQGTSDFSLTVGVTSPAAGTAAAAQCEATTRFSCTIRPGPAGTTVMVSTELGSLPAEHPRTFTARVYRGQTIVNVMISNNDRQGPEPVATRPVPALTADQIVELALASELHLFP
ncbi:hypothetical protein I0C86_00580 [Plantactinospora sp. S1510]|uniref:DUF5642 domain-containing protein n=1 Tax=Plantactinospora alkalitolerans TaxID=2789879 RepID=A0ABS0GNK8_9ACTN|nr:hypothetical protein [Plantactinospora alkalitolerans]MBF9127497.1 hypothetical protein [Plantactinospora alkalitolerans]